jgi:hypothetical protein
MFTPPAPEHETPCWQETTPLEQVWPELSVMPAQEPPFGLLVFDVTQPELENSTCWQPEDCPL